MNKGLPGTFREIMNTKQQRHQGEGVLGIFSYIPIFGGFNIFLGFRKKMNIFFLGGGGGEGGGTLMFSHIRRLGSFLGV